MLPLRRLAVAQAPRLLRAPVASPSFVRSFHSAPLRFSPIPTSTDDASNMSSTRTAGKGMNESGSKNDNAPNAHNPDKSTSNPGRTDRPSTGDNKYGDSGAAGTTEPIKEKVKRAGRKAKAAVTAVGEDAQDNAKYAADKGKAGYANAKAEVKHTVRKAKNSAKQTARDIDSQSSTATPAYTTAPATAHSTAAGMGVDTGAIKEKARSAADSAKQTASNVFSSVKQAASSAMEGLKGATAGVTAAASEKASEAKDRMAATQESASSRLSQFGERMEAKFEKFGEDLLKSGDEIDRRNREPGEPRPEPLPLDEIDHMPNPKNKDDVLPGTGYKDQQRNTPITDRKGSGQFPG